MLKLTVYNSKREGISRRQSFFPPEKEVIRYMPERDFREVKVCRHLEIRDIKYVCPKCRKEFDSSKGLTTHMNMSHGGK